MREFFILLKYGITSFQPQRSSTKKNKYNSFKNTLILSLFGSLPLGIIVFFFSKSFFTKLNSVDPQITKLLFLFWMTILSLFFIIGYIGMAMYAFSRNEEIELLLTMPIKRKILTIYQIFVSTISQIFVLSFYFFIYLAYSVVTKENLFLAIIKIFTHFLFLLAFSSVIAILLGKKANKGIVRKINLLISLSAIFFYFFIISFQNINVMEFQALANLLSFSNKAYNFLVWSFISSETLLFAFITAFFLIIIFSILANNMAFESIERKTKKNYKIKGSGSVFKAIFYKDFKAVKRYEQFLYFILYPIGFGIFFSLVNKDPFVTIFTIIPITTFYVAFETAILTTAEVSNIKITLTYPIKLTNLMVPKISIPTILNFLIVVGVFLISSIKMSPSPLILIILPISFLLFTMSSIIGMYFVVKNPPSTENMSKIFGIWQTLTIEGITMGTGFGAIFPLIFLSNPQASYSTKLFSLLAMIGSITVAVIISITTFKKLKRLLLS
ncbi:hypothetical protein [Thermosipho atlanticus]|uniref:ABC-2 type transport system permease protein n=1 Tax=Thermosipho atlanticus DSM 15807 TaxID=1123380 RepID=A0A1M5TMB3_9BACT|nr:hypothetical protein [Thermosipho atlanticus]SHH51818.1 ABC-2 type transport system permease protein [Thermosipho atlanticus DSM 15807]